MFLYSYLEIIKSFYLIIVIMIFWFKLEITNNSNFQIRFIVSMKIKDNKYEEIIIADNKIEAKRFAKISNPN